MDQPVVIILHGYDFQRYQFTLKAPCLIPLDSMPEGDLIGELAHQLCNEHNIYPRRMKIIGYEGESKDIPKWSHEWYDISY